VHKTVSGRRSLPRSTWPRQVSTLYFFI
jgi:hypothetical protein